MNIEWNKVTWYSIALSAVFILGVLPALAFYIYGQYELAYPSPDSSESARAVSADPNLISYSDPETGISFSYPKEWGRVEISHDMPSYPNPDPNTITNVKTGERYSIAFPDSSQAGKKGWTGYPYDLAPDITLYSKDYSELGDAAAEDYFSSAGLSEDYLAGDSEAINSFLVTRTKTLHDVACDSFFLSNAVGPFSQNPLTGCQENIDGTGIDFGYFAGYSPQSPESMIEFRSDFTPKPGKFGLLDADLMLYPLHKTATSTDYGAAELRREFLDQGSFLNHAKRDMIAFLKSIAFAQKGSVSAPASSSAPTVAASPAPGFSSYDNFGIAFQYPSEWGVPKESFYGDGLGSVYFDNSPTDYQPFSVFIEQDTDPQGSGLLHETLDQMISRYRSNDQYIYQVKNISADGVEGRELFYNSAVTGQPYHVEAIFPFGDNSYVSLSADYQSVPQAAFDSLISTLKWDSATAFRKDPATGMAIYSNNGIRFEYPEKFNTDYASLVVGTSVEKAGPAGLDNSGCYPAADDSGKQSPESIISPSGIRFCSTASSGVGAGQANTAYAYTTIHDGNAYKISYSVETSNGCGAYENSPEINAPENKKYDECLDFQKNGYDSLVLKPIQDSISTFAFLGTEPPSVSEMRQ